MTQTAGHVWDCHVPCSLVLRTEQSMHAAIFCRCSYFSARAPPPPPKEEGKDGGLASAGSERMTVQFAQ